MLNLAAIFMASRIFTETNLTAILCEISYAWIISRSLRRPRFLTAIKALPISYGRISGAIRLLSAVLSQLERELVNFAGPISYSYLSASATGVEAMRRAGKTAVRYKTVSINSALTGKIHRPPLSVTVAPIPVRINTMKRRPTP